LPKNNSSAPSAFSIGLTWRCSGDIYVFNMVILMLQQSGTGEVDEEAVLSQLAMQFPHERPHRILRAVVAWARYAELFKHCSTRKVLYGLSSSAARA